MNAVPAWASKMGADPKLTKSRRHACLQCDYKTGNVSDLRKHVRAVHEKRRDRATLRLGRRAV